MKNIHVNGLFWTDKMEPGVDVVTMLTSLTIFLLYSSAEVTTVEPLQTCCIQTFRAGLESKDPIVSEEG